MIERDFGAWLDEQLRNDEQLRRSVEERLARLRVAEDIAHLRAQRSLTQAALARAVGMKQSAIARIESGRARNLTLKTLNRIAAALDAEITIALTPRSSSVEERFDMDLELPAEYDWWRTADADRVATTSAQEIYARFGQRPAA
jgi:transcriptional regulator with XRE-family HTH domain